MSTPRPTTTAADLGPTCLSVPGCERQRLTYGGACSLHTPGRPENVPPRCQAPIRCYCWTCSPPASLGPAHSPESIRLMLAAKAKARAAGGRHLQVVAP